LTVVDAAATTIAVTGNAHLTLTHAGVLTTSVNASGMTVAASTAGADTDGLSYASEDLTQAATITGSAGVDSLSMANVLGAFSMTIDGGLGGKAGQDGDTLIGGAGNDTISFSGLGNATLSGNAGIDTITGSTGDDDIIGGAGADVLNGGGGNDSFVYNLYTDSAPASADTINGFVANTATTAGDTIELLLAGFSGAGAGGANTAGTVNVTVAANGTLAIAALNAGTTGGNQLNAVLDASTGTLFIDGYDQANDTGGADGTADMAIILTGVSTIDANAFDLA
jgi:Ca2+-binding RTX toxin-like protein